MPTPGKNFPGQRGFPTPNNTPDDTVRRIFIVPNNEDWLGLLEGAAQVLLDEWRYYDWGALTPEETVAAFNDVILASYTNLCQCELPGGGSVIRLNPSTGRLEELGTDGTWVDPSGDYTVPPITPRSGGTPQELRCLAAANAANVLQILYESITDSIASHLETAEAYTALVEAFTLAVGWEFAPIAFALAAFFLVVFGVIYSVVQVIGADLWDSTFTDVLKCALYSCANDDGTGVITFDWLCTQDQLAASPVSLTVDQVRLYLQLEFIVQVIGGVDGLNIAGATTSITTADCAACGWCYEFDFTITDGGFVALNGNDPENPWVPDFGTWASGIGWQGVLAHRTVAGDYALSLEILLHVPAGSYSKVTLFADIVFGQSIPDIRGTAISFNSDTQSFPDEGTGLVFVWNGSDAGDSDIILQTLTGYHQSNIEPSPTGSVVFTKVIFQGEGDNPFGADNC